MEATSENVCFICLIVYTMFDGVVTYSILKGDVNGALFLIFFNWEFKTGVCSLANGFIFFFSCNSALLTSFIHPFMSAGSDKLRSLSRQLFSSKGSHWTGNVVGICFDSKRLRKRDKYSVAGGNERHFDGHLKEGRGETDWDIIVHQGRSHTGACIYVLYDSWNDKKAPFRNTEVSWTAFWVYVLFL